eukprot:CAMPEP_0201279372 /NCGR_PEP_ID=MMETSP0853-20130426/60632_1 /ASSEMBLY_ACC=CAM_ASM_000640 /TAXON_ID=183588 /ORGANISM="Pseudo-nitzschia fraudulenta, Strain WWA7" /LENGTH=273 /DNA_ID=CAMNT_0047587751 /DNA_START=186 /DNA_END=1007 /DNA_ORIENTATION=-
MQAHETMNKIFFQQNQSNASTSSSNNDCSHTCNKNSSLSTFLPRLLEEYNERLNCISIPESPGSVRSQRLRTSPPKRDCSPRSCCSSVSSGESIAESIAEILLSQGTVTNKVSLVSDNAKIPAPHLWRWHSTPRHFGDDGGEAEMTSRDKNKNCACIISLTDGALHGPGVDAMPFLREKENRDDADGVGTEVLLSSPSFERTNSNSAKFIVARPLKSKSERLQHHRLCRWSPDGSSYLYTNSTIQQQELRELRPTGIACMDGLPKRYSRRPSL